MFFLNTFRVEQQQAPLYNHYTGQPAIAGTSS